MSSLPPLLSWQTACIGVFTAILARAVARVFYHVYLSPLAAIPGPPLAAVSNLWFEWNALRFRRVMAVHDALEKYGSIVRIGPNTVAVKYFNDVRTVYRSHKFRKAPWYDAIQFGGVHNSISTSDPDLHTVLRRWSAPAFRKDNLRAVSEPVREVMHHFVERMKRESEGGAAVDVLHLFKVLALDVLGVALFGLHFDQMKSGNDHHLAENLDDFLIDKGLANYLPGFIYGFLKYIPSARLRHILGAEREICDLGAGVYDSSGDGDNINIIAICKAYRDPSTNLPPPKQRIVSEAAAFLSAGTDTTSIALTYISWYLARFPEIRREVWAELSPLSEHQLGNLDILRALPYLNAFIKEVLRVHNPGSGPLPRVVPPEGAQFQGHFIPGGTLIAGQSWTVHRDPDMFPDPLVVRPERWIQRKGDRWEEREVEPEVAAAYIPFILGPRACVGRPLAEMTFLMVAVTLVRHFRLKPHVSTTLESMSPIDLTIIGPVGRRCLLHFELDVL